MVNLSDYEKITEKKRADSQDRKYQPRLVRKGDLVVL